MGTVVLPGGNVSRLAVDYNNANILYLTFYFSFDSRRVFKSIDAGVTWQHIDGTAPNDLPDIPVSGIIVDPNNVATLYVATDVGVFKSTDSGASWLDFSEGMPTNHQRHTIR